MSKLYDVNQIHIMGALSGSCIDCDTSSGEIYLDIISFHNKLSCVL